MKLKNIFISLFIVLLGKEFYEQHYQEKKECTFNSVVSNVNWGVTMIDVSNYIFKKKSIIVFISDTFPKNEKERLVNAANLNLNNNNYDCGNLTVYFERVGNIGDIEYLYPYSILMKKNSYIVPKDKINYFRL